MISVRVGFDVDDMRESDVVEFLRAMQPIHDAEQDAEWRLELSGRYFGPTAAVVVASARLLATVKHQPATVELANAPPPLRAFYAFSGLGQLVNTGDIPTPPDTENPRNETAALQQFHRMSWGGSTPIVRLIRRHLPGLGIDSEDVLRSCYSEVAQNIEDHAQSPIGGVICARYFANKHEIRIAVADRGLEIGETLRRAQNRTGRPVRNDEHALRLVLEGGVSSKSRDNNMGQGISNLSVIARGNGGCLMIVSGRASAIVREGPARIQPLSGRGFPGTLVVLSLQVATGDSEHDSE